MNNITNELLIENLKLSVRSFNCLKRNDINTVGDLLELNTDKLMLMRNMGRTSIKEILDVMKAVTTGNTDVLYSNEGESVSIIKKKIVLHYIDEQTAQKKAYNVMFLDQLGLYVDDIPVTKMGFSNRTMGALMRLNCESALKIVNFDFATLKDTQGMGEKSLDEIIEKLSQITLVRYVADGDDATVNHILDYLRKDLEDSCENIDVMQMLSVFRSVLINIHDEIKYETVDELMDNKCLLHKLYSDNITEKMIEKYIISLIGERYVSYSHIKSNMPKAYLLIDNLDNLLLKLKVNKMIDETDDGYCIYYPDVKECIPNIKNDKAAQALTLRMQGKTLEETGNELGVTRERARQLAKKALEDLPKVKELKYQYWYENYAISKKDFLDLLDITEESYNFLSFICNSNGNKQLEEIFEDENLTESIAKRAERVMGQYTVLIKDEYVSLQREKITRKILEKYYSEKECGVTEFYEYYNEFLSSNGLEQNEKLQYITEHAFEARIADCNYALMKYGRRIRYYNITDYDIVELFRSMGLDNYDGFEISTLKLFMTNQVLMQEYNLQDEYELHNLMKKCEIMLPNLKITLGRMPFLTIGNADRGRQVEKFLYRVAPIGLYEFADAYEEEYGVKSETVVANFISYIHRYYHNSMFTVDQEVMNPFEYDEMKKRLIDDFYFISDLEDMYMDLFPTANRNKINPYNLKMLGFLVFVDYVIRNTYETAENYFRFVLTRNDEINMSELDRRICYNQSFSHVLEILRTEYKLLEIEQNRYITYDKFSQIAPGVTPEQLKEYAISLSQYTDDTYFTVHSVHKHGFHSTIDDYGLSDWFYGALLRSNKSIKYGKMAGGFLFAHTENQISRSNFFKFIVSKYEQINILDFIQYIDEEYGLRFDRYDITPIINSTSMIYSPATEMIYYSREDYLSGKKENSSNGIQIDLYYKKEQEQKNNNGSEVIAQVVTTVELESKSTVDDITINTIGLDQKFPHIYDKVYRKLKEFTEYYHFEVTAHQLYDAIVTGSLEDVKALLHEAAWAIKDKTGRYSFYDNGTMNYETENLKDKVRFYEFDANKMETKEVVTEAVGSNKYKKILKMFSRGYRIGSALEAKKFRRYYEEETGNSLLISDELIDNEVMRCGILYENRVYEPTNMLDDKVANKLGDYIQTMFAEGKNMLYYEAIFQDFQLEFSEQQIYSTDMLKRYLEYQYRGQYYIKRTFMTNDLSAEADPVEELKKCLISNARSMTFEELAYELPHIPLDRIKFILASRKEFVRDSKGSYFTALIVNFTDDELRQIEVIIADSIKNNGFMAGNKLLEILSTTYPDLFDKLTQFQEIGKRDVIAYWMKERFSFNSNIISEYGKDYKMQDIFAIYTQKHDFINMDMLISLKEELNTTIYFDAVYDNALRINENEFVSKKYAMFSIEETDNAIGRFCTGPYIPIEEINQFALFPDAGYLWNTYLLESYVYSFSRKYVLMHTATFNAKVAGVIVDRESRFKTFDDVVVDALAQSGVELTEEFALDYLSEKGYIARKKVSTIEQIRVNAKLLREKRSN